VEVGVPAAHEIAQSATHGGVVRHLGSDHAPQPKQQPPPQPLLAGVHEPATQQSAAHGSHHHPQQLEPNGAAPSPPNHASSAPGMVENTYASTAYMRPCCCRS
jgi:hypothetical protein